VRQHPALGSAILATLPFLAEVSRLVLAHHERWDGGRYPDHAAGDAIPQGAWVLAVADAYLAMTSDRAWRRALRPSEALGVLVEERGKAYDPAIVDAFVHLAGTGKLGLVDQTIAIQTR
jgi:HD-GYP domain-containing protein (c-di-GMP phosphodiesterase class II)